MKKMSRKIYNNNNNNYLHDTIVVQIIASKIIFITPPNIIKIFY